MIRHMPIQRAKVIQGKSSEFYFIQACKYCSRNELTTAIDMLNKGLAINPRHLLCRLNHGVILFKLGLMTQAKRDFAVVCEHYPKELIAKFNLALTLLQLGEYEPAVCLCEDLLETAREIYGNKALFNVAEMKLKGNIDREFYTLLYDTFMVNAQCFWRLGNALEAVKSFSSSFRYKLEPEKK